MSFLVNFLVFSNFKIVYTIRISTFFYNFLIEASLYQFYIFFHFGGSIYYNFLFDNSLYLFLPMSSYYTIPAHCVWEVVYGRRLLSLKLCVSSKMNYAKHFASWTCHINGFESSTATTGRGSAGRRIKQTIAGVFDILLLPGDRSLAWTTKRPGDSATLPSSFSYAPQACI